jgi:hypothetical protein
MALPNNITTIILTGQYLDFRGLPIAGQVKITNPEFLVNAAANRLIVPTTITAQLDATGAFTLTVPVTNDADVSPLAFTYSFEESFIGGATYSISLPSSLGATVDIADIRPTDSVVSYIQPASGDLVAPLNVRITQEETDLNNSPSLVAAHTYTNLRLFNDRYSDFASAFATYGASTVGTGELNFTAARIREIIDRINDLADYTASSLELRDTTNGGTVSGTTYAHLTAKLGTYAGLASAYATYALSTGASQSWTYAQVGTLLSQIGLALSGTGTLTDAYLSKTKSVVEGNYGALAAQGFTYATLAAAYATYGTPTGATFTFTYRDTADTLRTEAYRLNRLLLIGAK